MLDDHEISITIYDTSQNPGSDDFITMTDNGSNTDVAVDRDGAGSAYSSQAIAVIAYQTGLDADAMLSNGNLIAV